MPVKESSVQTNKPFRATVDRSLIWIALVFLIGGGLPQYPSSRGRARSQGTLEYLQNGDHLPAAERYRDRYGPCLYARADRHASSAVSSSRLYETRPTARGQYGDQARRKSVHSLL